MSRNPLPSHHPSAIKTKDATSERHQSGVHVKKAMASARNATRTSGASTPCAAASRNSGASRQGTKSSPATTSSPLRSSLQSSSGYEGMLTLKTIVSLMITATPVLLMTTGCGRSESAESRTAFDRFEAKPFVTSPGFGTRLHVSLDGKSYAISIFPGPAGLVHSRTYNLYAATPGGRYFYTPKTDRFEFKVDYAFMPSSEAFQNWVASLQAGWKTPALAAIALPGTFGSDGPVSLHQDKRAVRLLSSAIDQIRAATGATSFHLSGVSAAGPVIAGLVAERRDVTSAAIASAPFDLQSELRYRGIPRLYSSPANPIDGSQFISEVARSKTKIVLIADRKDKTVPYQQSKNFARAIRKAGGSIDLEAAAGSGPDHRFLTEYAVARMLQMSREQRSSSRRDAVR